MNINAGQIIVMTSGQYAEYRINGQYRALKDFDTKAASEAFLLVDQHSPANFWLFDRFRDYLLNAGLIEELSVDESVEWHLGSDGELVIE